jgi:cephalosporin hydroxylase
LRNLVAKVAERLQATRPVASLPETALTEDEAEIRKSASPGPIEQAFFSHQGRLAHKWVHFLPVYDRLFAPYRGKPITFLELGVSWGGSLQLWRSFFGPEANIHGVDVIPDYIKHCDPPTTVHIGSQADPEFLRRVVEKSGPPDIVLDDGSHVASHQRASFKTLFPLVKPGGLYVIEDLHTAYWPKFEGGFRRPGTGIEMIKALIDDQHGWYHSRPAAFAEREQIGGILVFDSLTAIERIDRPRPGHFKVGLPPAGASNPDA